MRTRMRPSPIIIVVLSLVSAHSAMAQTPPAPDPSAPEDVPEAPPPYDDVEEPGTTPSEEPIPEAPPPEPPPPTPPAVPPPAPPAPPAAPAPRPLAPPTPPPRVVEPPAAPPPVAAPRSATWQNVPGVSPPVPPASESTAPPEDDTHGLFGPIRIGPYVGTGLPNILNFGAQAKFFDYVGVGINFGMIPDTTISYYGNAELSYREYDIHGRLYPFGNGFFLGAGVGYHSAKGTLSKSVPTGVVVYPEYELTSTGSVKAMILTPQIGWFSIFSSGFALGIDIGGQIPIAPSDISYETAIPTNIPVKLPDTILTQAKEVIEKSNKDVVDTLEKIGKTPIPVINIRLGFMF